MAKRWCWLIAFLFGAATAGTAPLTITSVRCTAGPTTLTVRFEANGTIERYQRAELSGSDIVVRIIDADLAADALAAECEAAGVRISAQRIREFQVFRIRTEAYQGDMSVQRDGAAALILTVQRSASDEPAVAAPVATPRRSNAWELDVIVIDAGHGGKDAGAKGANGAYEKDVTLQIALRLRDLVRKELPNTSVVMTRDDDTFVELHRRTQIANNAKGKLFISIHCNSMPKIPHPAQGCETYILRPGRNEDAARVAATENASIALESAGSRTKALSEDELILATMAQRSFVRYSEELAGLVQKHVSGRTGLKDRGVNQAGFLVLVGASMPNILFETAFLSNHTDAALITSRSGQEKVAQAMLQAIQDYASFYQQSLKR